jgi:hypothetical protein
MRYKHWQSKRGLLHHSAPRKNERKEAKWKFLVTSALAVSDGK